MLRYRIEPTDRRVIVVGHGELIAADVKAFVEWQIKEGLWEYGLLYDMSRVTRTLNSDELAELVDYIAFITKNLPARGPVAVLTTATAMADSTAEYARLGFRVGLRVAAFENESDAIRWLNEHTTEPPLQFIPPSK